jgi:LysM repeat protein
MKKFGHLGVFFGISVVLMVLLAVGVVGADPLSQEGEVEPEPGREGEIEPEPKIDGDFDHLDQPQPGEAGQAEAPQGAAARIDFEQSADAAREGWYVVQEEGGRMVSAWYAQDGWQDSGWINDLNISHEAVHVRVLYYPYAGAEPTVMKMLNHAGGSEYGWLAKGMEHALEVEFPDTAVVHSPVQQPVAATVPTVNTVQVAAPAAPVQPAGSAGEQVYVVQAGNNLYRIGLLYGCSYPNLAAYNGIPNPDRIYVGQQIRIPANCTG